MFGYPSHDRQSFDAEMSRISHFFIDNAVKHFLFIVTRKWRLHKIKTITRKWRLVISRETCHLHKTMNYNYR